MTVVFHPLQAFTARRTEEIPVAITKTVQWWLDKDPFQRYRFRERTVGAAEALSKARFAHHFSPT